MFLTVLPVVIAMVPAIFAAPPLRKLIKMDGEISGKYLIRVKDGVNKADVMSTLSSPIRNEWTLINGFAVDGSEETLSTLLSHPGVETVQEDGMAYQASLTTQTCVDWGLGRLSASTKLDGTIEDVYTYTYDESGGEGVDIYIIDSGLYTNHTDFEDRAFLGANFVEARDGDGTGHGTACGGIAAGKTYGVAKKAHLYAVKVLDDEGAGSISDILSGLDFVSQEYARTKRPSVANLSFVTDRDNGTTILDEAVEALVASGVHVTVAAGNFDTNAEKFSPAHSPSVITVGATEISDRRANYTNFGAVVDIFAPGSDILTTYIGRGPNPTRVRSGTSMAAPYVAGLIAYFIGLEGNISPEDMKDKLRATAQQGVLSGLPPPTENFFVHNGAL